MSSEQILQLCLFLPLATAVAIRLCDKNPLWRESATLLGSALTLLAVLLLYRRYLSGDLIALRWFELLPGLAISFHLEALGMLFALVAALLWPITSIYSIGYMRGNHESHQTRFFMLFPVAIFAAFGIAFAGNLLTLFVFYELMTFSTFPLVTHKGTDYAVKAGRVYLGVLLASSIGLLLPAILWVWYLTGTTDFSVGGILSGKLSGLELSVLAAMFVLGIGKAAVMPLHRWLPAAMVAPTPVSALLHAVAVVKAGVFSVLKVVVYIFGIDYLNSATYLDFLLYLVGFTLVMSSIIALSQDNLKKRLAYSTISQLAYVVLAGLLLAPLSIVGAALHIAAHAFGKITLFFAAGSIYTAAHKTEISQLDGIGRAMPWTMTAFAIGALSMIGLPPAVGFISKWYIVMGAFEAQIYGAVLVIVISTLLNAAYFLPIVYRAFFLAPAAQEGEGQHELHGEAPWPIVLALSLTAGLTLMLFLFPQIPWELAQAIRVR